MRIDASSLIAAQSAFQAFRTHAAPVRPAAEPKPAFEALDFPKAKAEVARPQVAAPAPKAPAAPGQSTRPGSLLDIKV